MDDNYYLRQSRHPSLRRCDSTPLVRRAGLPENSMVAILFKLLVALGTGALGVCALRIGAVGRLSDRGFIVAALGLQVLPAILLFIGLYVVAGQEVTSDVAGYYMPPARAVLAGQVPYRDFPLSYAPLFPYIGAALLQIW